MIPIVNRLVRTLAGSLCLLLLAATANAQAPDSVLQRLADSLTVGDYCSVTRAALEQPTVASAVSEDRAILEQALQRVCDPRTAGLRLRELIGAGAPTLASVARLRQDGLKTVLVAPLDSAMTVIFRSLRNPDLAPVMRAALGAVNNTTFFTIVNVPQDLFVQQARDRAIERLAKYERKLGPQSPKLNGLEVFLNYAVQRWVPGFAPSVTRGPSSLELIASYVPGYATIVSDRVVATSATEFGLRHYLFGSAWGMTGWRALLRPAYMSGGLLVASNRSNGLAWPWDKQSRPGVFVAWGETKIGWVPGRTGSVMIARQLQFIPFVF